MQQLLEAERCCDGHEDVDVPDSADHRDLQLLPHNIGSLLLAGSLLAASVFALEKLDASL